MLVLDPDVRLTADEALKHPYFDGLRDPEDCPEPLPYDDSHDNATLPLEEWKRKLFLPIDYLSSDLWIAAFTLYLIMHLTCDVTHGLLVCVA